MLVAAVRHGLLTPSTALAFARQAEHRVVALSALAGEMPPDTQENVLDEALRAARSIDDTWKRAEALVAAAQRLPAETQPYMLGEALNAARSIDDAWARADALEKVVPCPCE